jgi:hypothetical protein
MAAEVPISRAMRGRGCAQRVAGPDIDQVLLPSCSDGRQQRRTKSDFSVCGRGTSCAGRNHPANRAPESPGPRRTSATHAAPQTTDGSPRGSAPARSTPGARAPTAPARPRSAACLVGCAALPASMQVMMCVSGSPSQRVPGQEVQHTSGGLLPVLQEVGVPGTVEHHQFGIGQALHQQFGVPGRAEHVVGAVQDEGRGTDSAQFGRGIVLGAGLPVPAPGGRSSRDPRARYRRRPDAGPASPGRP